MMFQRVYRGLFFVALALGFCVSATAEEKTIHGWGKFIDPAGDCKVRKEKERVTFTVPGTEHNLNPTEDFDNVLGPRLLQEVEGDFDLQVQVAAFERPKANTSSGKKQKHSYVAAGVLLWQDDKTFLRCFRAGNGDRDEVFVHVEAFQDSKRLTGRYYKDIKSRVIADETAFLRVQRRGKEVSAWQSLDGKKWDQHAKFTFPSVPKALLVGVGAVNATTAEFAPQFEELSLTKK